MRPDEAVVLIGKTPPPALYYCFRSYIGFIENKPKKDYSEYITVVDDYTGLYHMIFASLGDQLNNYNIWTDNTPKGASGKPFNSSTIIISTADRNINKQIRNALGSAGYSKDIMNDDNIPMELVNMGLEAGKDTFIFMMRFALWADQNIGSQYLNNIDKFIKVFRITPKIPLTNLNPWPVPTLKIRETGITEYQVVPNSRRDFDHLRNEIVKKYGGTEYDPVDLDLTIGIPGNYNAILRDFNVYGDNRDAVYFKTEDFKLTSDDDFVIVYGINHERTGKAYGVDNNEDVRIVFSVYLNKKAMVGPYVFDVIWDRAILFAKKKKYTCKTA